MKKIILIIFIFFVTSLSAYAKENIFDYVVQPIRKQQEITRQIREELSLSPEQQKQQAKIDLELYLTILSRVDEITTETVKIRKLRKNAKFSKEDLKLLKEEYEIAEKKIDELWDNYDIEFKKILTFKQKIKYLIIKKHIQKRIKKKIKQDIKKQEEKLKKTEK